MTKKIETIPAKKVSKATLKARARRAEAQARMGEFAGMAYKPKADPIQFTENAFGSKVRVTKPSEHEVADFFWGRRAFDIYEVLEELGTGYAAQFCRDGLAVEGYVKGATRIYMITTKAAKRFNLPKVLPNGCPGAYAKVA